MGDRLGIPGAVSFLRIFICNQQKGTVAVAAANTGEKHLAKAGKIAIKQKKDMEHTHIITEARE